MFVHDFRVISCNAFVYVSGFLSEEEIKELKDLVPPGFPTSNETKIKVENGIV